MNEERKNIISEINNVIAILGQLPVRIDQLANVGLPITDCIQRLGRAIEDVKKLKFTESEEGEKHEADNN